MHQYEPGYQWYPDNDETWEMHGEYARTEDATGVFRYQIAVSREAPDGETKPGCVMLILIPCSGDN